MGKDKIKKVDKEIRQLISGLEARNIPGETEEDIGKKMLVGYAAKFNEESVPIRDYWGDSFVEIIAPGAFANSIRSNVVKALYNHNSDYVLGSTKSQTLTVFEDNVGLRFELELPNTNIANDLYESVKRGDTDGVSFGFRVVKDGDSWSTIYKDEEVITVRTIKEVELIEISPTAFPAYDATEVDCRSLELYREARKKENTKTIEKEKIEIELELLDMEFGD